MYLGEPLPLPDPYLSWLFWKKIIFFKHLLRLMASALRPSFLCSHCCVLSKLPFIQRHPVFISVSRPTTRVHMANPANIMAFPTPWRAPPLWYSSHPLPESHLGHCQDYQNCSADWSISSDISSSDLLSSLIQLHPLQLFVLTGKDLHLYFQSLLFLLSISLHSKQSPLFQHFLVLLYLFGICAPSGKPPTTYFL